MGKSHLKRIASPVSWKLSKRKGITFVVRPKPGRHPLEFSVPITIILREMLGYAETSKEVKLILQNEKIFVNGKEVKDHRFNCGIFDVIKIEKTGEKYMLSYDKKGKFILIPVKGDEIISKVISKKIKAGEEYVIGLQNSYNIKVTEKEFKTIKVGDSIRYNFKTCKFKHVPFKEGTYVFVIRGKYVGECGKVKSITRYNGTAKDTVAIEGDKEFVTAVDNCCAIGTTKKDIEVLS